MLAKCQGNLAVHQEDYRFKSEEDVFICDAAEECISGQVEYSSSVKFVSDVEKNLLKRQVCQPINGCLNPLTSKSDQRLISPFNITPGSSIKDMRG